MSDESLRAEKPAGSAPIRQPPQATPKTDQAWPFFLATFFLATFFLATFFLAIEWLLATGTQTMELTASAGAVRWKQSTFELLPCRASTEHDSNSTRVFKNWSKDCQERSAKNFCFSGAGIVPAQTNSPAVTCRSPIAI